jgi:hypothetical protein
LLGVRIAGQEHTLLIEPRHRGHQRATTDLTPNRLPREPLAFFTRSAVGGNRRDADVAV